MGIELERRASNGTYSRTPRYGIAVSAPIAGLTEIVAVAAGGYHGAALGSDGSVFTWGQNDRGQVGNGSYATTAVPGRVEVAAVTSVACGAEHTVVVHGDGSAEAWGCNRYGQLGNGDVADSNLPVPVSGLDGAIAVAAGYGHSLALRSDGTVRSWGE